MMTISSTYSPEDNKLRIYTNEWLDEELFQRFKHHGFVHAPKQELFVAPKWTPAREDFCIELAGEITAEQTTLIERAQAKAERLDELAAKRSCQASEFHAAAQRISERFESGQPILVGHHSERRARKDQERMDSSLRNAIAAQDAVRYWNWRAEGVERHANMKASVRTRLNRIKTLLAELRDRQRSINHAHRCLEFWRDMETRKDTEAFAQNVEYYAGAYLKTGAAAPSYKGESMYDRLREQTLTPIEAVTACISFWDCEKDNPDTLRWINHILNRLDYERYELGEISRFIGDLTPVILQGFCRTQGADKPKASKTEQGFKVVSPVPLPLHIAEGKEIDLTADAWRDLMQSVGYEVIIRERKKSARQTCPLINPSPEEADKLQARWNQATNNRKYGSPSSVLELTQTLYSANSGGSSSAFETINLDENGFRIWHGLQGVTPVCRVRVGHGGKLYSADRVIVITDKPQKPLPVNLEELPEAEGSLNHG